MEERDGAMDLVAAFSVAAGCLTPRRQLWRTYESPTRKVESTRNVFASLISTAIRQQPPTLDGAPTPRQHPGSSVRPGQIAVIVCALENKPEFPAKNRVN